MGVTGASGKGDGEESLEKVIHDSLWGSQGNLFHTEYDGDHESCVNEMEYFRTISLNAWDVLVPKGERDLIEEFDTKVRVGCPYLWTPDDSLSFHACIPEAKFYAGPNASEVCHPLRKSHKDSEESHARKDYETLKNFCFGKYTLCPIYKVQKTTSSDTSQKL